MKITKAVLTLLSLSLFQCHAYASTQLRKDVDDLNSLFMSVADMHGQFMLGCNRNADLVKMINTVVFAEKAYQKLNKGFPVSNRPLDEQLFDRIELSCRLFSCNQPQKSSKCDTKYSDGTDSIMWRYDAAMKRIGERLKKASIDVAEIGDFGASTTRNSCQLNAQHYQDAYIQSSRIDDLICFRQAINRELK